MGRQNATHTPQPPSDQTAEVTVKRGPGFLEQAKQITLAIVVPDPKAKMRIPCTGRTGERILCEPKPGVESGFVGFWQPRHRVIIPTSGAWMIRTPAPV